MPPSEYFMENIENKVLWLLGYVVSATVRILTA